MLSQVIAFRSTKEAAMTRERGDEHVGGFI